MKELKFIQFDSLVAKNGREFFVQATTTEGVIGLRFPVTIVDSLHQVLDGLEIIGCSRPSIVVTKFLDPIFSHHDGVALLHYVAETGVQSYIGIEATALPSLQEAIRQLPWSRCDMPAPYGSDA
ncbi:hypothetical protein [Solidesulfovibrio sp. C21]|uniref:hypothetical protein n=1 Tax=Solidesulfovibrio sp. C21 TaxID=3398613 RepID=UPI0039FC7B14